MSDRRPPLVRLCIAAVCSFAPCIALAVPVQPPRWSPANAELPVVANGVLLFQLDGDGSLAALAQPFEAQVFDPMGVELTGSELELMIESDKRYAVFEPSAPFTVAPAFSIAGSDPSAEFTTIEAEPIEPGSMLSATTAAETNIAMRSKRTA